jgi:hypothetical protein
MARTSHFRAPDDAPLLAQDFSILASPLANNKQLYPDELNEVPCMILSQGERTKVPEDRALGSINLAFLHYAGYTATEIARLGDLSRLPEQDMQRLIREKAEKALVEAWKDKPIRPTSEAEDERPQ